MKGFLVRIYENAQGFQLGSPVEYKNTTPETNAELYYGSSPPPPFYSATKLGYFQAFRYKILTHSTKTSGKSRHCWRDIRRCLQLESCLFARILMPLRLPKLMLKRFRRATLLFLAPKIYKYDQIKDSPYVCIFCTADCKHTFRIYKARLL